MICKNCGKEFDGKFCPECGTKLEEVGQELTQCPQCGSERIDNGKFCINCGYNYLKPTQYEELTQKAEESNITPGIGYAKPNKFLNIFSKIYRWLLAGGMILVGIVSLLCLTAPILKEEFLGEVNNLCTGFQAIGGKEVDVPSQAVNASVMLLVVSLIALVYGGVQLFFAFKKPYINTIGKKKFVFWGIDGAISLVLIILGAVVSQQTKSEELMDAKLGSGFAMAIVMGVFGLLFLGARIFYELKLFKWEDTGLSEEQVAKITEKKERKKLTKKQIMAIVMPVVTVAILIAVIVPSVSWATNIFRVGKVDKINIGDSQEQVIKILGEPYKKNEYSYEYYSDNYLKVLRQLEQLNGNERGLTAFASSDDDFDDIDWDDEDFGEDKETKLEEQLRKMTYQYIRVEFDSNKKVSSVLFDAEKCDSKEYKKVVKSYEVLTKDIMRYSATDIIFSAKFTDKSLYKGLAVKDFISFSTSDTVKWTDIWGNDYSGTVEIKNNPNILYADKCGDNAWYELRSNGELIVSGYGIIDKKIYNSRYSETHTVKISSGITTINANSLFSSPSKVKGVIFEEDSQLTSIGAYAFSDCSSLTSIVIPSRVMSIGSFAFSECSSLTSIEIPSNVTSIGDYAFYRCSSLTIYCEAQSKPSGWDSSWNFDYRPVVWNFVEHGVTESGIKWGLTKDGEITIAGYSGNSTYVEIPSTINRHSVTSIGNYAFRGCSSLTSIEIPSSVTSIGEYAFSDCSNLTSISIPSSVTSIGVGAFSYCNNLTSINIPSSVISIGRDAFYGCSSLTIYCEAQSKPSGWDSSWNSSNRPVVWNCVENGITESGIKWGLTKDGEITIAGYSGMSTELVIPSTIKGRSVTSIYDMAFYNCSNMISIEIPSSVTSIGLDIFFGCDNLTNITVDFNNTKYKSDGNCLIEKDTNTLILGCKNSVIPNYVTIIGVGAFLCCNNLTSINIPSSVISIGRDAFYGCSRLTSVVIPSSVTSIGYRAFFGCSRLTIYCEAESQPSGWDSNWDYSYSYIPVVWGYKK